MCLGSFGGLKKWASYSAMVMLASIIGLSLLLSSPVYAINKCVSESGKVSYQEKPCPKSDTTKKVQVKGASREHRLLLPDQNWGFRFETGALKVLKNKAHPARFHYEAQGSNNTVLSIFVEPAAGKGDSIKSCADFYWRKTAQNPMIIRSSVDLVDANDFIIVMYVIEAKYAGQDLLQTNFHLYGHNENRCVDVHMSQIFNDPKQLNFEHLKDFAMSLAYIKK